MREKLNKLSEVYQYLDKLFDQDVDSDTLFASGYIRGIISLIATGFGDEQQQLSKELMQAVSVKLGQSKTELSPQDNMIVNNFWTELQKQCSL